MRRATASVFSGLVLVADDPPTAEADDSDGRMDDGGGDDAADGGGGGGGGGMDDDATADALDGGGDGAVADVDVDGRRKEGDDVCGTDDLLDRSLKNEDGAVVVVLDLLGDGMSSGQPVVDRSYPSPPAPAPRPASRPVPPSCSPPRGIRGDTGVGGGAWGKSAASSLGPAVARSSVSVSSSSDDERSSSQDSATCFGAERRPWVLTPPLLFEASGLADKDNASRDFWTSALGRSLN